MFGDSAVSNACFRPAKLAEVKSLSGAHIHNVHFIGAKLGTSGLFLVFGCVQLCDIGQAPPDGVERPSRRPFGHSSSCLV